MREIFPARQARENNAPVIPRKNEREDTIPARSFYYEYSKDDDDVALVVRAETVGRQLRTFARENKIDLHQEGWIDPASLDPYCTQLADIFNKNSFTPAYIDWRRERTTTLAAQLCTYDQFRDMAKNWPDYNNRERIGHIAFLSRLQQCIFADNVMPARPVTIGIFESPPHKGPPATIGYGAHYAPEDGMRTHEIEFNTHPDARLHNFFNMLTVAFHENLHAVQHGLADSWLSGRIAEDNPLAREARLFMLLNNTRSSYIHGARPAYLAHPMERDAFAATDEFQIAVRDEMQKNRIKLAPGQTWQFQPLNLAGTTP